MFVIRYNFNTETYNPTAAAWGSQAIKLFCINNMVLNDLSVTFIPTAVLKHSRKDKPLDKFEYGAYVDKTCVIACLKEYISRSNKHEGLTTGQLITSTENHLKELP